MDNSTRVLKHLLQLSRFVQIRNNIASSHKLSIDEQLGERWPISTHEEAPPPSRIRLQILSNRRTREDISTCKIAAYV